MNKTSISAAQLMTALASVAKAVSKEDRESALSALCTRDKRVFQSQLDRIFRGDAKIIALEHDGMPVVFISQNGDYLCLKQAYACSKELVTFIRTNPGFQLTESLLCPAMEADAQLINELYAMTRGMTKKNEIDGTMHRMVSPTMGDMMANSEAYTTGQKLTGYFLTGAGYIGEIWAYGLLYGAVSSVITPIAGGLGMFVVAALAWAYVFIEHPNFVRKLAAFGFNFADKMMSYIWPAAGEKGGVVKIVVDSVKAVGRGVKTVGGWVWKNTLGRLFGKKEAAVAA